MNVAIVQNKPRKGDIARNLADIEAHFHAIDAGEVPDLIVLPEGALTGYFLEGAVYDLALEAGDFAQRLAGAWRHASGGKPVDMVAGFFENDGGTYHNSALYMSVGETSHEIRHIHRKVFLPTYGVFDEERFLSRGSSLRAFETKHGRVAILICEDAWHSIMPTIAAVEGARYIIIPSASPGRGIAGSDGELESVSDWLSILRSIASEHGLYVVYAGLAGFEGGKGMTGSSAIVDPRGNVLVSAPVLGAAVVRGELDPREIDLARASLPLLGDLRAVLPDLLRDLKA